MFHKAFDYVVVVMKKYNIDESHALKHAMEVLMFAKQIYHKEVQLHPELTHHYNIICMAAILHDTCDKKYMDENQGIQEMTSYMSAFIPEHELNIIVTIIRTMSYSKVKKIGYPILGHYQLAYHIVREADLLAAYDIDRCIIFGMLVEHLNYDDSLVRAKTLFKERVLTQIKDGLFTTSAYEIAQQLHLKAMMYIKNI